MESRINPVERVSEERPHSHDRYAHRGLLRLPGLSAALGFILLLGTLSPATAEVHRRDLRRGHGPLVDALGDTLPAGPHPERIVSLSPNLTEILYALGVAPARIVGVTRYCDFPPEAKTRPVVGGIVDPSLETIQMGQPDVVLAARGNPRASLDRMRDLGITVFAVDDQTGLDGVRIIISQIAALVGPDDWGMADRLQHRFWSEPRRYQAWADSIPVEARPSVYYGDPEHPGWTAGPGSHIDDLIRLAGGRNVIGEGDAWPQISAERLTMMQPDYLLLALPDGTTPQEAVDRLGVEPGWGALTALRTGRICWVPSGELLRPGPRLLDALASLAACLHPSRTQPVASER